MSWLSRRLAQSTFAKALLVVSTGGALAQLLNLAIQPVLTRAYTVEDFGLFALFLSALGILGPLSNLRYDAAITMADDDADARDIFWLCQLLSLAFSTLFLGVAVVWQAPIRSLLNLPAEAGWLFFVPPALVLNSLSSGLSSLNYRARRYHTISSSSVIRVLAAFAFQVAFSLFGSGYIGLILGFTLSVAASSLGLLRNSLDILRSPRVGEAFSIRRIMRKYSQFPLYQLPASWVNHFTYESITFSLAYLYDRSVVGLYSLSSRVLVAPLSLFSESSRQILVREISDGEHSAKQVRGKLLGAIRILTAGSVVLALGIGVFGEVLFGFFFGARWTESGTLAQALLALYCSRFVSYPLTAVAMVFRKQWLILLHNVVLVLCVFVFTALAANLAWDARSYLLVLSIAMGLVYVSLGLTCYRLVGSR